MFRNYKTAEKTNQPHSLLALSIEAAAEDYRFDPRDLFSYHRDIDFTQLNAGALTKPDYGLTFNCKLPRWLLRRLPENVSTFLDKRRFNIHELFTELAAKIVNFDGVEEIDKVESALGHGVNPLPKFREKYIKYAQQMAEIEKLGIGVNKGDQLQKLMICIQRERQDLKLINRVLGQKFFPKCNDKEKFAGGDGPNMNGTKSAEISDHQVKVGKLIDIEDTSVEGPEIRKAGNEGEVANCSTRMEYVLEKLSNRIKDILSTQVTNRHRNLISSTSVRGATVCTEAGDYEQDEMVLYGMICA